MPTYRSHEWLGTWALWSHRPGIEYQSLLPAQGESQLCPRTNPHIFQKLLVSYRIKPHVWCFSLNALSCTSFYTNPPRLTLIAFLAVWHSTLWPCSLLPFPKNESQCVSDFCYSKQYCNEYPSTNIYLYTNTAGGKFPERELLQMSLQF